VSYTELAPNGPVLSPFQCLGDAEVTGPCVSVGMYRGGGVAYISRRTIRDSARLIPDVIAELASEIGWVAPDDHAAKVAELEAAVTERDTRLAELEPMERAIARASARWGDTEADDEPVRTAPKTERAPRQVSTAQRRRR